MLRFTCLCILLALTILESTYAQSQGPAIAWKKSFGGSRDDRARSIIQSYDNGLLVAGTTKSDNGDLTAHFGSTDSTDAWLIKLDDLGNIEWQKNYGGTGNDEFVQVIHTNDQEFVALGSTNTVNNGDVTGFHTTAGSYQETDIWVVKLNRQGAIVWQRCLGGSGNERPGAVRQTPDGGYIVVGTTQGVKDGDVPVADTGAVWVIKLSSAGNIEWSERYGGTGVSVGNDVRVIPSGGYVVVGENRSYDGDFPVAGYDPNSFSLKISNDGTILSVDNKYQRSAMTNVVPEGNGSSFMYIRNWQNCVPMNNDIKAITIQTTKGWVSLEACDMTQDLSYNIRGIEVLNVRPDGGKLLAAGTSDSRNLSIKGGEDAFLGSFQTTPLDSVKYTWKQNYGGSLTDAFTGIVTMNDNAIVCSGYTNSTDGDVTGNHGSFDCWVVKFAAANYIKGNMFLDKNNNGVQDAGEPFVDDVRIQAQKDTTKYATSPFQGEFGFAADTGTYSISVPAVPQYHTVQPALQTAIFTGYGQTKALLPFALQPIPGKRDYEVRVAGFSAIRPGFDVQYWFSYANIGTDTLVNRPVKLIKDSRFQFQNAVPAQTGILGDTMIWNIPQLLPGASALVTVILKAAAPPVLNIGDTILLVTSIDSTDDVNKVNNVVKVSTRVTGSFDPNDKQEAHGGTLYKSEYDAGNWLTYTIRFQNTGTDTAFNVEIRDTLTNDLQGSTLQMIAASHPYTWMAKDNKYYSWIFKDILLPDSNRNEPQSHGFVTFRVKPRTGLAVDAKLLNTASIFFDFNLPVVTNTHVTTIKTDPIPAPAKPVISGLVATYCSVLGPQKAKITNLPPTGGPTTAAARLDNTVLTIAADSTFSFEPGTLGAGSHQVVVSFTNVSGTQSTSTSFEVVTAVIPDVNLTANITNVVNLTNPVIITAFNAAGGGTAPQYTFAWDKAMTNILQAESAGAVFTLTPSLLKIGDNKVFVRMKTSAACYIAQTGIDSILIRRDAATGIMDPDNRGQSVLIFPNPFGKSINISGLNSGKLYSVTLTNATGQVVYAAQILNKQTFEIPATAIKAGLYWVSIYDGKKKLLGTEQIVKY